MFEESGAEKNLKECNMVVMDVLPSFQELHIGQLACIGLIAVSMISGLTLLMFICLKILPSIKQKNICMFRYVVHTLTQSEMRNISKNIQQSQQSGFQNLCCHFCI